MNDILAFVFYKLMRIKLCISIYSKLSHNNMHEVDDSSGCERIMGLSWSWWNKVLVDIAAYHKKFRSQWIMTMILKTKPKYNFLFTCSLSYSVFIYVQKSIIMKLWYHQNTSPLVSYKMYYVHVVLLCLEKLLINFPLFVSFSWVYCMHVDAQHYRFSYI